MLASYKTCLCSTTGNGSLWSLPKYNLSVLCHLHHLNNDTMPLFHRNDYINSIFCLVIGTICMSMDAKNNQPRSQTFENMGSQKFSIYLITHSLLYCSWLEITPIRIKLTVHYIQYIYFTKEQCLCTYITLSCHRTSLR